ncbi:MAG: hypothetical protein N2114_06320, partial [Candidatus Goldbacteria bacterium]|nr:hypothetical protein [Candidatus Goldiibacteriota bacterium]
IKVKIAQHDIDELTIRIYTAGYRLIKEVKYEGASAVAIARLGIVDININDLKSLANGTYYFYINALRKGKTCKSKIEKFIILR